ncbi:aqp8 [Pungitius sinensis]
MSGAAAKTEVSTIAEGGAQGLFEKYVQPCLAELLGTGLLVLVGCSSVIGNVGGGVVQPAAAHGLALAVLIVMFGPISGGHLNPAVSLCVYLCGGAELTLLLPYVLTQLAGAVVGAGLTKAMFPHEEYNASHGGAFNVANKDLGATTLAEALMTLFLTMVVAMGAVNSQTRSPWVPFCVGLTVTANIFAGGSLSGACMNPARAFGPAVVANHWSHHWIYWVGPACGALLTVVFIRLLFGDKKTRIVFK